MRNGAAVTGCGLQEGGFAVGRGHEIALIVSADIEAFSGPDEDVSGADDELFFLGLGFAVSARWG